MPMHDFNFSDHGGDFFNFTDGPGGPHGGPGGFPFPDFLNVTGVLSRSSVVQSVWQHSSLCAADLCFLVHFDRFD